MFSTMAESRPFQSLYSCKGGRDENETISPDFKNGGLKNVDINKKIASLQCSWIKRLYDDSFHEWKLIPLKLIKKSFGDELKFHSNLSFNKTPMSDFFHALLKGRLWRGCFFLWVLQDFWERLFCRAPLDDWFCLFHLWYLANL